MIAVCNANGGSLRIEMVESLLSLFGSKELRARAGTIRFLNIAGLYVPMNRDYLARRVLEDRADWMLTVDSDMSFDAADVLELLRSSDVEGDPDVRVVGGLYVAPLRDGMGAVAWTRFQDERLSIDAKGLQPVDVVGTGLLLVHRTVLVDVLERFGTIFDYAPDFEQNLGEDVNFCRRARAVGHQPYVNMAVRAGHVKDVHLVPEAGTIRGAS